MAKKLSSKSFNSPVPLCGKSSTPTLDDFHCQALRLVPDVSVSIQTQIKEAAEAIAM